MSFTFGFDPTFFAGGLQIGQGQSRILYMLIQILQNMVTDVKGLNLTLNGTPVNVVYRKGLKVNPVVDGLPSLQIYRDKRTPMGFEYLAFKTTSIMYPIAITVISPNNRDFLTNLDTYVNWWDSIIQLYIPPSLTTTTLWGTTVGNGKVWDVRVVPEDFLEPDEMANNFDAITLGIKVKASFTYMNQS